ncbi:MAG TPA: S1 RNA-binding domain-containing protein [Candidatus Paceibacterota bacterium]|jgi:ribosomal protein S1|nr:S1 RNA-binding domain-containing protein [Candidatus Paceibacterota bacterium]
MPQIEEKVTGTPTTIAQVLKTELSTADWPKEGTVVEVTLMKKAPRKAYFDMGRFGTGIVYGAEMQNAREALRNLKPGDKMHAKIVDLDGEEGHIELSVSEAGKQKLWQQAKEFAESGEVVKAKVAAANAGGLMVTVSDELKAFLPVSQLSLEHYPKVPDGDRTKIADELKKFVGEELSVKIIDVNPRSNKIIVSEREVLSANVKELLTAYTVGQVIDCIVSGVADFGVFVRFTDNPQIEGMIHISELDYKLIDNPKELVKVNDQLKAKIVDIKEGRVFLSLKALKEDPWAKVADTFKPGDAVQGKVYKFNPFGAVIALPGEFQGMIHISEYGGQDEMKKALVVGETYPFVIDTVKPEEKRITLKAKK